MWLLQQRVGVEHGVGCLAGALHQRRIGGDAGQAQVERGAALERALDVAGAAQLQIDLGYAEAIVGGHHGAHALARVGG